MVTEHLEGGGYGGGADCCTVAAKMAFADYGGLVANCQGNVDQADRFLRGSTAGAGNPGGSQRNIAL